MVNVTPVNSGTMCKGTLHCFTGLPVKYSLPVCKSSFHYLICMTFLSFKWKYINYIIIFTFNRTCFIILVHLKLAIIILYIEGGIETRPNHIVSLV